VEESDRAAEAIEDPEASDQREKNGPESVQWSLEILEAGALTQHYTSRLKLDPQGFRSCRSFDQIITGKRSRL